MTSTKAQRAAIAELVKITAMIALEAPERKSAGSPTTYVDWTHVLRIREILPAAGVDYQAARTRYKVLVTEQRERERERARLNRKESSHD